MSIMKWVLPLYGIVLIAFGLYVFGIGLWGLAKKRPLIFPARQLMWFLISMYVPLTIQSFAPLIETWGRNSSFFGGPFLYFFPIFQTVMFLMLIIVYWRQMTGYMIFGVSDETFHDALASALDKLNIPFEETVSRVKLIGINADLQAAVASWMGSAQIRIKQRQHAHYAKSIANAMAEYFKVNVVKVNNFTFILYLILGILMIIFVIFFGIFLSDVLFSL